MDQPQHFQLRHNLQPTPAWVSLGLWTLVPFTLLQILTWISNQPFSLSTILSQYAFLIIVLIVSWMFEISFFSNHRIIKYLFLPFLLLSFLYYAFSLESDAAWAMAGFGFAFLIQMEGWISQGQKPLNRFIIRAALSVFTGGGLVSLLQIEERFSEEEFFAALQAIALSGLWFLLVVVYRKWMAQFPQQPRLNSGFRIGAGIALLALFAIGSAITIQAYQNSFFQDDAPSFPEVTDSNPFFCGTVPVSSQTYTGELVFDRLMGRIEENPQKGVLEFGLLTAEGSSQIWANQFHDRLLEEAHQQLFTSPENSVKYGQCQAARRAYFYHEVITKHPDLFNRAEKEEISKWFAGINTRAFKIGWVDWMYALAFRMWPSAPYENQECGAGLLAILEATGLANPDLSAQNLAYLSANQRGWQARFRNTDDTYAYQPEWLHHAYFQFMNSQKADPQKIRGSFEWFLLQALPDGSPLRYNHFVSYTPGLTAYWASRLFSDTGDSSSKPDIRAEPDLSEAALWLAGRSADYLETRNEFLFAHPGMEITSGYAESSPSWGSCLIYADSGLPNQIGSLAPDKVVFRDGWDVDSTYLLLNLRFSGWHRYKATNSIILAYQSGPILSEVVTGDHIPWLPKGRSLLRDKRIPRENLNGLLVERTGLSAIVHSLTSIGSIWAQDPPHYARVEKFEIGDELDLSTTVLEDWRGWNQTRTIYFQHEGPIVIVDRVEGPADQSAALSWHVSAKPELLGSGRFLLQSVPQPVELLLIPIGSGLEAEDILIREDDGNATSGLIYTPDKGSFTLVTAILTREWYGAQTSISQTPTESLLSITKDGMRSEFSIP